MQAFAGSSAPTGWLLCNGTTASRTTYSNLFSVIGTTYGVGDGSTTFGLPDMRGRVPMGAGTGNQLNASGSGAITAGTAMTPRTAGAFGGEETHLLSSAEIPAHSHPVSDAGHTHTIRVNSFAGDRQIALNNVGDGAYYSIGDSGSDGNDGSRLLYNTTNTTGLTVSNNTGGGGRHAVVSPFVVLNYIIKAIPDTPRGGMTATYTPPIVTSLPLVPQFGDQVVHLQTVAGTTYSTLKQWDGTAWVAVGPQPATTWVSPTLNSPWTNYGGGWQPARYTRDAMGTVFVEGLVNSGLVGSAVFNLPAGFRPAQGLIFSTVANNTFARLDIGSNGDVVWNTGGTSGFVSISCNFKASQ
jgi:microcystin-dependent protein